jgi:catechol 2,3-dioxygenase-like lactoylglutathione lyase family enzyme
MNLNQVTIPSIDVEKAAAFYTILGLKLIVDALPEYVRFECPDGDATFSIHKVDALPTGENISVFFEDDNLDNLVRQLQSKGVVFTSEPEDTSFLWRIAQLRDPDGNKIILYHAGKNRKNPPWRIS